MSKRLWLAIAAMLVANQVSATSLVGDTISGSLVFDEYPGLGNALDPADGADPGPLNGDFSATSGVQPLATVTEDDSAYPEFLYSDTGSPSATDDDFLDVVGDVDASSIHIEIIDRSNAGTVPNPPGPKVPLAWTFTISGLDFDDGSTLSGATVSDNVVGFDPFQVTVLSPSAIEIKFLGRLQNPEFLGAPALQAAWSSLNHDNYLSANITLQTVPIPGAAWLFGSGLLALFAVRRRYASV